MSLSCMSALGMDSVEHVFLIQLGTLARGKYSTITMAILSIRSLTWATNCLPQGKKRAKRERIDTKAEGYGKEASWIESAGSSRCRRGRDSPCPRVLKDDRFVFLKERLCEDASDCSSEERSLSVMTKKEWPSFHHPKKIKHGHERRENAIVWS